MNFKYLIEKFDTWVFKHAEGLGQIGVFSSFIVGSTFLFISPIAAFPFFLNTFFCLYYLDLLYSREETSKRRPKP